LVRDFQAGFGGAIEIFRAMSGNFFSVTVCPEFFNQYPIANFLGDCAVPLSPKYYFPEIPETPAQIAGPPPPRPVPAARRIGAGPGADERAARQRGVNDFFN
jgi:hypothetical protein